MASMKQKDILKQLLIFKDRYKDDGFNIVALFGSYANNKQNTSSDIDILYDVNEIFLKKYKGFKAVSKTLEIENELSSFFHKKIDFTSLSGVSKSIKDEIVKKAIYV